ncbi:MAG TPA: M3 family metallopeptidase [Candidatus Baltobacteraceae bacterium]
MRQPLFAAASALAFLVAGAAPLSSAAAATGPDGVDWAPTPHEITANCAARIAAADAAVKAILAARAARTFATVVLPLENASADLSDATTADTFAAFVATEKPARDAANDCQTKISAWYTATDADPNLEQAVAAASKSGTDASVYDKKLTSLWLTALVRAGAGLPAAKRAEFVKLSNQLDDLETKFGSNLAEDHTTVTLTKAQVAGIPAGLLAGDSKPGPNGSYVVSVNESTGDVLQYATNESGRKAYYLAYDNIAAAKNVPLLEGAIAIRDRLAHLMGYPNWAAYVLADRMAGSPARVESFLNSLDAKILPKAREQIAVLRRLKVAQTHDPKAVLHPWDVGHFDYVLNKTKYAVDADAIRQYFPVQHTIDSVLNIYHTLLGVNFTQVADGSAWAPGVLEYSVTDSKSGKTLGYTYFDLFPRPGKYNHFANFGVLPYRKTADPTRVPVAAIVGNWPKPGTGQPALLSHEDVVTFFHEFGHDMAAILGTAPYETLSSGFREDFVEAPSQMLENFVWQPSILKQISSNWQTGKPLPDATIAKMIAAKYVDYAYSTTRQIMLADIDMAYHTSGPKVDTTAVWLKLSRKASPVSMVVGTHPQATFGHLMGGYDAGYYGYLWSKVYAQDMFSAFLRGGLENPAVGQRYRTAILEPARTYEPDAEVARFLGRPMSPDAFYAEFGIAAPKK